MPDTDINADIRAVMQSIRALLSGSPIGPRSDELAAYIEGGKHLRARLLVRAGRALGRRPEEYCSAAAAIELMHTGSLLHDDLVDGSHRRRGRETFWRKEGAAGAVLFGDLLFFLAVQAVRRSCGAENALMLMESAGETAGAECRQELLLRGGTATAGQYLDLARRKTGSFFGFAAACPAYEPELRRAMREAGCRIGAAYQAADDLLDAFGSPETAGKTLREDSTRGTISAARVDWPDEAGAEGQIRRLISSADSLLSPWPAARQACGEFVAADLGPAIDRFLQCPVAT